MDDINNVTNNENEGYDTLNFYILVLVSPIFIFIYIFYLCLIITYIIRNYHTKKLCIYWIDYCILDLTGIIFIFFFILNLFHYKDDKRSKNLKDLSTNFHSNSLIYSLTFMCVTIIGSLFFDGITALLLSQKMKQISKIVEKDFFLLAEKFKGIQISNILTINYIYIYYIIFASIDLVYMILCILAYRDLNINRIDGPFNLYYYFSYLLRYYHLFSLILLLFSIIIMNKMKKLLLNKEYNNPNRIAQKIYDVHLNQVVYYTDIISFKLVSDLIMNIPALFFLSLEQYNAFTLFFSEIVIFIFIFLGGNQNLILDKDNLAGKMDKRIRFWFCFRKLDFHFGEKDHRVFFDEFKFNYSEEELKVFKSLNLTIIKNIEYNLMCDDESKGFERIGTYDSILGLDDSSQNIYTSLNVNNNNIDFKTISEFYLVQKLMMLYFKTNEKIYESAMDNMDESFLSFKKIDRKSKRISLNYQNKEFYLNNIDRVSRISINNIKKIKPSIKLSQNDVFTTIEEKELLEELNNKLKIKGQYTYKIESLFTSELFELFPFYQMKINSIIKSLNPTRNIKIFDKFVKRNNNIKTNFTITNYHNNLTVRNSKIDLDNDKNGINIGINQTKKEMEKNLYYTYDLYLMYEIYEKKDFVNFEDLEAIILEYNSYLKSVVKNMNYTFLPLILGIFSLEIYGSTKIIVLYRNPLYFTIFNHFIHWINFYITEEPEKIRVSSLFNDVIDVNEIEIRNGLQLNESDYEEVKQILEKDYSFLKKVENIYPIIHLFIGDENSDDMEENGGGEENKKIKKNQYNETSILGELSINKDIGLVDVLEKNLSISNFNNQDEFNEINNIIDENSLFDKEYYYMSGKDIRTIKIYFTNLFRKDCELNKNQDDLSNRINSDSYCDFLQGQLIKYLRKNSLFNENDENKVSEEKEINN